MDTIGIIDYSMGNLHSIKNALNYVGAKTLISGDPDELENCDAYILPGVGAFSKAMEILEDCNLTYFIKRQALLKPILGICLGMQLFFETGNEFMECDGLGLLKGVVRKIEIEQKVPHVGWNSIEKRRKSDLLRGIPDDTYFYFVHSYRATEMDEEDLVATTDYGLVIPSVVENGNVYATQFHPEKSAEAGLKILENFIELI